MSCCSSTSTSTRSTGQDDCPPVSFAPKLGVGQSFRAETARWSLSWDKQFVAAARDSGVPWRHRRTKSILPSGLQSHGFIR